MMLYVILQLFSRYIKSKIFGINIQIYITIHYKNHLPYIIHQYIIKKDFKRPTNEM